MENSTIQLDDSVFNIIFKDETSPQRHTLANFGFLYLHVQQTPKPLAHDPAEVPPLLEHSDLKKVW